MKKIIMILMLMFGLFIIFQNLYLYKIAQKSTNRNIYLEQKVIKLEKDLCAIVGCIYIETK